MPTKRCEYQSAFKIILAGRADLVFCSHDIMLECWRASPETRPSFADLAKRLGDMLQDSVKDVRRIGIVLDGNSYKYIYNLQHYLDLNEPYLQMNTDYFRGGKRDYFSSMGPPETPAPPVPTYVNTGGEKGSPDKSYLKMSPKSDVVFYDNTKTETDGVHLNQINLSDAMFKSSPPANNFDKKGSRQSKKPEEMPMLKHINELVSSDSETEAQPLSTSGNSKNGPVVSPFKTDKRDYVNVPSTMGDKPTIVEMDVAKDSFSNPTYLELKSYSGKK